MSDDRFQGRNMRIFSEISLNTKLGLGERPKINEDFNKMLVRKRIMANRQRMKK